MYSKKVNTFKNQEPKNYFYSWIMTKPNQQ